MAIRGIKLGENYCACPDFATNTLDTCKHIEFTLAKLENKCGGKRALENGFHLLYSKIFLKYGARRLIRFRQGEECPAELVRVATRYFDDEGILRPEVFSKFHVLLSKAASIDHKLRCYDDALAFIGEVRDEQTRRNRLAERFSAGVRSARLKKLMRLPMYEYQHEGALFAACAGRCLTGDEMGLGNMIQAVAAT